MVGFGEQREMAVSNMIKTGQIKLFPDFTENNIHFSYRDVEVTSELNVPYQYFSHKNPRGLITQRDIENNPEYVEEDFFRKIVIWMDVKNAVSYDNEDDDEDYDDEDEDEYGNTYVDKLKKHFPGQYNSPWQEKAYEDANSKRDLMKKITDDENENISNNDTLFVFAHTQGLSLFNDRVEFMAPSLSKSNLEWIFWAVNIIDKIKAYQKTLEEDDDYEEGDFEE